MHIFNVRKDVVLLAGRIDIGQLWLIVEIGLKDNLSKELGRINKEIKGLEKELKSLD